jgi:hypothetical protein
MNPALRLVAFAALLVALFALSAVAGNAVDPDTAVEEGGPAMGDAHGGAGTAAGGDGTESGDPHGGEETDHAVAPVKGLAISESGYTLELADQQLPAARTVRLRFRILDEDGEPLRRYAVEHERRMHLIVARRDNSGFQHLHPRMRPDGTWTSPIRFEEGGSYRVFADFRAGDTALTLGADLAVDGEASHRALPAPADVADTGTDFEVRLDAPRARAGRESELRFTVLDAFGQTVHPQPYLGAGGHLVALREGDLGFLHTHPIDPGHEDGAAAGAETAHDDAIPFEATFPTAGRYRLYLQFKVDGQVHTAPFTVKVTR